MNTLKAFFISQINESKDEEQLNYIIEQAAEKLENNADYCEIYELALNKARNF